LKVPIFSKITIIGVGLVGGSLALAARASGVVSKIIGVGRNSENLKQALDMGAIDGFETDAAAGVSGSDLVVLAGPVGMFNKIAVEIRPHLKAGCLVTDVGSVKGDLVLKLESIMPEGVSFIGGHPIAGGSSSGAAFARADLFEGARFILTPTTQTPRDELSRLQEFWGRLGSRVSLMDPYEHDKVFAAVSHLPHLVAYCLVNTVADRDEVIRNAGRGFLDTTRIASSPPDIWCDIFSMNKNNVLYSLSRFEEALSDLKALIECSDFESLKSELTKAKEARDRLADS